MRHTEIWTILAVGLGVALLAAGAVLSYRHRSGRFVTAVNRYAYLSFCSICVGMLLASARKVSIAHEFLASVKQLPIASTYFMGLHDYWFELGALGALGAVVAGYIVEGREGDELLRARVRINTTGFTVLLVALILGLYTMFVLPWGFQKVRY